MTPVFIREKSRTIASCNMNTSSPVMHFNITHLNEDFFQGRGTEQVKLVIHELGHAEMEGEMSHGPQWGEACAGVGAMIALGLTGETGRERR